MCLYIFQRSVNVLGQTYFLRLLVLEVLNVCQKYVLMMARPQKNNLPKTRFYTNVLDVPDHFLLYNIYPDSKNIETIIRFYVVPDTTPYTINVMESRFGNTRTPNA